MAAEVNIGVQTDAALPLSCPSCPSCRDKVRRHCSAVEVLPLRDMFAIPGDGKSAGPLPLAVPGGQWPCAKTSGPCRRLSSMTGMLGWSGSDRPSTRMKEGATQVGR